MKKINKILLISMLFGFAFSMIACKASSDDATGDNTNYCKVTFDKNYKSKDSSTKDIKSVEIGKIVTVTDNPFIEDHEFVGWSTKTTDYEAFDFSKPVTKDTTVYAIYKPILAGTIDPCINGECEFKTTAPYPFVLSDGSLYGIKAYYTINDGEKTDIVLTYAEKNISNVFTYTFEEIENYTSGGKLYITCAKINGEGEISGDIKPETSCKVKNLKVTVDDSYAKVSFTPVEGYTDYTVICSGNGESYIRPLESVTTNQNVEFFGLPNDIEYSFTVKTDKAPKTTTVSVYGTPTITKKKTDNLVIMYMDGDNNLNDVIYLDLNEVEYGLYNIRNSDGTPKTGYQSVNVVALWDGCTSYKNSDGTTGTPKLKHAGSYIYEVGTDTSIEYSYTYLPGCVLSSSTKNLSYTADSWLLSTNAHKVDKLTADSYGEVNMGRKSTLTDYLKWVQKHYEADNVYLQFSNHGGGPRNKAICWDETSGNVFLRSKDVSDALTDAGYGKSNKLSMLLFDVCLGASLEDAYQFRNFADYMVASPNTIPGLGFDYVRLMKSFTTSNTVQAVGEQLIDDYMTQYNLENDSWLKETAEMLQDIIPQQGSSTYDFVNGPYSKDMVDIFNFFSPGGVPTLSLFDLSKVENLANKVNAMANKIMNATEEVTIYNKLYPYFVGVCYNLVEFPSVQNPNLVLWYDGSFGWLNDLGYMAQNINSFAEDYVKNTDVKNASKEVMDAVKETIVKSKRPWAIYNSNGFPDLAYLTESTLTGMTIAGGQFVENDYDNCPDWYLEELDFGSGDWGKLLRAYFGE